MKDLESLARIAVIDDEQAAGLVSDRAKADLAARVSAVPAEEMAGARRSRGMTWPGARRGWLVGVPVAAALSGALLAIGLIGGPGAPVGIASAKAALVVTRHGHGVDVVVRNPRAVVADVQRFRKELRAEGADVSIVLFPVSPPMVGKFLGYGSNGQLGPEAGLSSIGGHGVRVSASFQGEAEIFFGRAAQPGESYAFYESATAPGEALAGQDVVGKTVSDVLPLLASAGVTPAWEVETLTADGQVVDTPADSVPGTDFVYKAFVTGPGQVLIEVGATPTPPERQQAPPGSQAPSGTASPAPSGTPSPAQS